MIPTSLRAATFVAVAAVLSACGGGGDASIGATSTLPPAAPSVTGTGSAQIYGIVNTFFSNQQVGTTSAPKTFTLTSAGSAPLVISTVSVTGAYAVTSNTCNGPLAPNATCTIAVTFSPTTIGRATGVVTVASNAPGAAYTISLDGTGFVASGFVAGQFRPSRDFAALCALPRSGVDPYTGRAYPDRQGTDVDERNWLRSWTNELYLWFDEVIDRDPGLYATTAEYFDVLKVASKDRFHFTYRTSDWEALSLTGTSADYGATFVLLASTPPRKALVAYTEPTSPAASAGFVRGTEILTVDGADLVNGGDQLSVNKLNAGLFPKAAGESHTFTVRDPGAATTRTVTLTAANVTSTPVQNVQTIPTATGAVGYLLFNDHIATSEQQLVTAFTTLRAAAVTDLVLDVRYNGGGYLAIASEVAYMIAGATRTSGKTFELTQFNSKYPAVNPVTNQALTPMPFLSTSQGFSGTAGVALPTLNLARVFVLTGTGTCSASESIINGLRGVDVQVIQIGSTTCGKPYGFYPADNCGTTYFSIQFRGVNAKGFGDYTNGFSPANSVPLSGVSVTGCSVADDFTHALGNASEGRLAAALGYRTNGSCNVSPSGFAALEAHSADEPAATDGEVLKPEWRRNRIL